MNTLDIIILIVLLLGTLNGLRQGLVKAFFSFIGWMIAVICAVKFSSIIAPMMLMTTDPVLQKILAFILLVVAVILISWLLTAIFDSILKSLKLSPLNRLAGAAFGGLKSMIILLVIIQALSPWVANSPVWQHSTMVTTLRPFAPMASQFAQQTASKAWHELRQTKPDARDQHPAETTPNPFN